MNGLEALEKLPKWLDDEHRDSEEEYFKESEEYKTIERELKALKIIKDLCNLKVYKNKLGQCFLEGTNILFPIPQKTYDLLKEVMK